MTSEGPEFINAEPDLVINHLRNRHLKKINIRPADLHVKNDGRHLKLGVGSQGEEYLLRSSFLKKLLKWYSFPAAAIRRLSIETAASLCNDYLLQIRRQYVRVTIEEGEALTITSPGYTELSDLEVIKIISPPAVKTISRNDFLMRITTEEKFKFQPVPGDECGLGMCIINSETGFHSLMVQHYILRYICTNGAMVSVNKKSDSRKHYGIKKDKLNTFLKEQAKELNNKRNELIKKFKFLAETKASENDDLVGMVIKLLGKKEVNISDETTLYDLINLITAKAKDYDLSKRIYLEKIAGEMMEDFYTKKNI